MTDTHQHPLEPTLAARVDRYLDDLGRMLVTASRVDRADALGSVREHLDNALAALGRPATAPPGAASRPPASGSAGSPSPCRCSSCSGSSGP